MRVKWGDERSRNQNRAKSADTTGEVIGGRARKGQARERGRAEKGDWEVTRKRG